MIELGFLGTGGAMATAERDNAAFLLREGERLAAVDCPGSVVHKIKKLGADPAALKILFLTHIHPDHIYGLPSLVHSLMLTKGLIPVIGSEETVAFAAKLLDLYGLRGPNYKTRVEFQVLRPDQRLELPGGGEAAAFSVRHHSSSLAFRLEFADGPAVLFAGDTPADPALLRRAGPVDVLVHDASAPSRIFEQYPVLYDMHTDALTLGRLAAEVCAATLIPVHFFGEVEFSMEEIEAEIRTHFPGRVIIPKDLVWVNL
jgi:ribonuclease Z